MHMAAPKVGAVFSLGELPIAVGFQLADLCAVVLLRRGVRFIIGKCPVSVTAKSLGQNDPPLTLREDPCVFLHPGVINDRQRTVKCVCMVRRLHQHNAVLRVQPLMHGVQDRFGFFAVSQSADDSPALGIQPKIGLGVGAPSDDLALLGKAADITVLIPAEFFHQCREICQLLCEFFSCGGIALFLGQLFLDAQRQHKLECHKAGFALSTQTQAVVPVGVGDHFVQKGEISRFCQILVDSREQPKCIIGAVGGVTCFLHIAGVIVGVLMTGIVCKLDQRQTSAVVHLCGEHKTNLFRRLFRGKMNHTLNVLYGIAVTVAVAQTAVSKGCCS